MTLTLISVLCGCLNNKNKPKQEQESPVTITGQNVDDIKTFVDNRLKQVTNEIWPWVVLFLGLGIILFVLLPTVAFFLVRSIRKHSYVHQYDEIMKLKKRACS